MRCLDLARQACRCPPSGTCSRACARSAERGGDQVFADNLRELLLAAPAGPRVVMGLDPGFRTGVKVAVVDATGKLVDTATVYPHEPRDWEAGAAPAGACARKPAA